VFCTVEEENLERRNIWEISQQDTANTRKSETSEYVNGFT